MELMARVPLLLLGADARARIQQDPELAAIIDVKSGALVAPVGSGQFRRVIDLTATTSGLRVTPYVSATTRTIESCVALRLRPAKVIRETAEDNVANRALLSRCEPLVSESGFLTRTIGSIVLSRFRIGARDIAGVDEWTNCFVLGTDVARSLASAGLVGASLGTVRVPSRGSEETHRLLLTTKATMPEAVLGLGTERAVDGATGMQTVRWNGPMVYATLGPLSASDFARSAEPENLHGMPAWLVSARMYRWYRQSGVRGLRFEPVLLRGTSEHVRYEEEWRIFRELLDRNPRNKLW